MILCLTRSVLHKCIMMASVLLSSSLALLLLPNAATCLDCGSGFQAYAAVNTTMTAGDVDPGLKAASGGFRVNKTRLDLSPKVKKVPYGHKYVPVKKAVVVKVPDSYWPISFRSSNTKVATAKWANSVKRNEAKLIVYGNGAGKATITITNSATYQKLKIAVTVNGYNSKDFKASKTKIDLSPMQRKVKGGVKFTRKEQTITVAVPDGASVHFESSNYGVASAQWIKKWKGNTTKLRITGYKRGDATITLTNSKTKKKVKIKVKVGGYGLGFDWGNPAKRKYKKSDGRIGYYALSNITLTNETGKTVKLDKKCKLRYWAINANYNDDFLAWELDEPDDEDSPEYEKWKASEPEYYTSKNKSLAIRGVPISVKKGKSKVVYLGKKNYLKGNKISIDGYYDSGVLSVKVGKSYKTIYVDEYGMVTKVLNGLKI